MADSVTVDAAANATLNETAGNATAKIPATIEGMSVAYLSLFLMAIFPIFIGSFRSVKHHQEQKVSLCFLTLCNTNTNSSVADSDTSVPLPDGIIFMFVLTIDCVLLVFQVI